MPQIQHFLAGLLFALPAFSAQASDLTQALNPKPASYGISNPEYLGVVTDIDAVKSSYTFSPNYFVLATDPDDSAQSRGEFLLSLRADLWVAPLTLGPLNGLSKLSTDYTGLYDFYWLRYSAPVISRLQNPSAFVWGLYADKTRDADYLSLAYCHLSNGQVIETAQQYQDASDPKLAQTLDHVQDYVSRGWDYWRLAGKFHYYFAEKNTPTPQDDGSLWRMSLFPEMRLFTGKQFFYTKAAEEDDFWNPVPQHPHLSQYDGLRMTVTVDQFCGKKSFLRQQSYSYSAITGTWDWDSTKNISHRIEANFKFNAGIPAFFVFAFSGYGPYVSDYATWHHLYGMGLRLWNS
jgi:hypothetical protein